MPLSDGVRTGTLLVIEVLAWAEVNDARVTLTSITGPPGAPAMATPARLYWFTPTSIAGPPGAPERIYWQPERHESTAIADGAFGFINIARVGPLPASAVMESPDYDLPWSLQDGEWRFELQLTAAGYSPRLLNGIFGVSHIEGILSQSINWLGKELSSS